MQSRFLLKVSKFPKQFMVSWTLPKNERKQFDLRYHGSKVECFPLFFGRIQETINCFRNILTCKETNPHFSISNSQSHFTNIITWLSNNRYVLALKSNTIANLNRNLFPLLTRSYVFKCPRNTCNFKWPYLQQCLFASQLHCV